MPFRLTSALSTFQRLMNHILKPYLRKFVLTFFDDILIYSKNWFSHLEYVKLVYRYWNPIFCLLSFLNADFGVL